MLYPQHAIPDSFGFAPSPKHDHGSHGLVLCPILIVFLLPPLSTQSSLLSTAGIAIYPALTPIALSNTLEPNLAFVPNSLIEKEEDPWE